MIDKRVQQVRQFNRFYTGIIGLLDRHILNSPYSLPEARVLYELYHHHPCAAKKLVEVIDIDKGYLSRVLTSFEKKGLLSKGSNKEDGRTTILSLTAKGEREFLKINAASTDQLKEVLLSLTKTDQEKLVSHMNEIKRILTKKK